MTTTRRDYPTLIGITATILVAWALMAIFTTSEFVRLSEAMGAEKAPWDATLQFQMLAALNWALFTPLIVFLAERLSLRGRYRWLNLALLVIAVPCIGMLRALWGAVVLDVGEGRWPTLWMAEHSLRIRSFRYMFIAAVIIGITKLMDVYRDTDARERRALALQATVADAEAEHLRAQTQPAFMFGTLQAIRERIHTDATGADRMLVTLGELLRRGLDRPPDGVATLEEELDFADRYLDLQRMRFGSLRSVHIDVDDDALAARVPALALQTLIEAALEHAQPARVEVLGRVEGYRLRLEARALPGSVWELESRTARIQQWFGAEHAVTLRIEGGAVVAAVELPLLYAVGEAA